MIRLRIWILERQGLLKENRLTRREVIVDGRVNAVGMKIVGKEDKCLENYQTSGL